jgi:hypothetical protein
LPDGEPARDREAHAEVQEHDDFVRALRDDDEVGQAVAVELAAGEEYGLGADRVPRARGEGSRTVALQDRDVS